MKKLIPLLALCLTTIGTLFIYKAEAQCPTGTAPYVSVTAPTTSTITTTSATLSTDWAAWSGAFGITVYIEYGTSSGVYTNSVTYTQASWTTGTSGTYSPNITGLASGTTYYARARIVGNNASYTCTSSQITFSTNPAGPFTITTTVPSAVTATTASSGGTVTPTSTVTVASRGVVWGTTINPTIPSTNSTSNGSGSGTYASNITGLTSSTTYYVRAYVVGNNGVTYYGPNQTFSTLFQVSGIVSPFSLSPVWHFGTRARYTFTSGSFPAVPPGPTVGTVSTTTDQPETSTSVSFRNGNTAIYTNSMIAANGGNTVQRTFSSDIAGSYGYGTCAGSSTGGGVSFPDPANNATNNAFYIILGNDITGGGCDKPSDGTGTGINQYRFTGTGTTVAYNSGQVRIADKDWASEAITAGTDGEGGYWVVAHAKDATNEFRVWHYTSSGVSGPVSYTPTKPAAISAGTPTTSGGYLKFSPCMDKIAFTGFGGNIIVYNFDRTTGAIGTQLALKTSIGHSVGLEFSPDGSKIYYSGQGSGVRWFLISNPATEGTVTGATSWTMQMGPDAQLYTSGAGGATVGVITNPNSTSPGHSSISLAAGSSTYRGLSNIAWLSPQTPTLAATTSNCDVNFRYAFLNYFNDTVTTNNTEWSWDNGATWTSGTNPQSRTFPNGTSYNVRVRFRDTYCNQTWTQSITGSVSCTLPVEWLNVSASGNQYQILVNWSTSSEKNNAYFIIEKSYDGKTFTPIGKVNGSGNNSGIKQYEFVDNNPLNGFNYYRIVQYDYDNNMSYSNTVVSSLQGDLYVTIAPNPSQHDFQLKIFSSEKTIKLVVTDILGREIYNADLTDFTTTHFGENFSKGTYIVRVIGGAQVHTQKIIKE